MSLFLYCSTSSMILNIINNITEIQLLLLLPTIIPPPSIMQRSTDRRVEKTSTRIEPIVNDVKDVRTIDLPTPLGVDHQGYPVA